MKVRCLRKLILCGKLVVSRFFEASICITLYGVSVPSLNRESTDSDTSVISI